MPYGGILAVKLQPGETVLVSGATGSFGSAAVAVALAACVVAPARNEKMLAELVRRRGPRVRTVHAERQRGRRSGANATRPVRSIACLISCQAWPNRRVVLMGGAGGQGGSGLELPYPWIMRNNITLRRQWMYPREASVRMIAMVRAGLLSLDNSEATIFDLDHINEAVAHVVSNNGAFETTVLQP